MKKTKKMKHIITILTIFIVAITNVTAQTNTNLLENTHEKVAAAFRQDFQQNEHTELGKIDSELASLYKEKPQNLILYWRAYTNYYISVYYLVKGDKDKAEKFINKAVEWLDDMENKNSEDYALLSITQGFSIQFKNFIKKIMLSKTVVKNGELAVEKNAKNLRAYYALASNDFYRPEQYGGGKVCEKYLLKAIQLPKQEVKNAYLPSWGKKESYAMLIRWYIRKKEWTKATKYYEEATNRYPKDWELKKLKSQIKQ